MRLLVLSAILLFVSLLTCNLQTAIPAPIPKAKVKQDFAITAGRWEMTWGSSLWRFDASDCGACETVASDSLTWRSCWRGHWRWQATTQTLTIEESRLDEDGNQGEKKIWSVTLDEKGQGKANYANDRNDIPVTLSKVK